MTRPFDGTSALRHFARLANERTRERRASLCGEHPSGQFRKSSPPAPDRRAGTRTCRSRPRQRSEIAASHTVQATRLRITSASADDRSVRSSRGSAAAARAIGAGSERVGAFAASSSKSPHASARSMLRRNGGIAASSWRAVAADREAGIEDGDDAPVGRSAQEPAGTLGQDECRDREVDGCEGIDAALFGACCARRVQGLVRRRERDAIDHDEHARGAGRVDARPERAASRRTLTLRRRRRPR